MNRDQNSNPRYAYVGPAAFDNGLTAQVFMQVRGPGLLEDGAATVWVLYVWNGTGAETLRPAAARYSLGRVTFKCSARTYAFNAWADYSAEGALIAERKGTMPFQAIREQSSDVYELSFACWPAARFANPGRTYDGVAPALMFAALATQTPGIQPGADDIQAPLPPSLYERMFRPRPSSAP